MARNVLASMLDELMGKHRNALPSEKPPDIGFEDPDVCKYFLSGFCHHELFNNTKADLGFCTKTHDEKLREAYRASDKFEKLGYEDDWLIALQRVHSDMQRRIVRNKQRLALTQPGISSEDGSKEHTNSKLESLSEKITALLQQAETLGEQGRVEEAQQLIEKSEQLKAERDECRKVLEAPLSDLKAMEVCETCGCFLIIGDASYRIEEHYIGKQHLGYAKVKATIEELTRRKEERRRQRDEELRQQIEEREKLRKSDESRRHSHSRHRSKSRSPDRDVKHSRSYHSSKRTDDYRHHRHYGDSRRRHHSSYGMHGGRNYNRDHYHSSSSSQYPDYNRRHYHRRSRSPRHRHSKSPQMENGKKSEASRLQSVESASKSATVDDTEPGYSASTSGYKVKNSSPDKVLSPAPQDEATGAKMNDDEDEEGLISSSSDE